MANNNKVTAHRSSVSGRFVTPHYAKTHPRTTTTERNPAPKPPSKGR